MDEAKRKEKERIVRRKLDLLLRTGQLLVESAADTSRIIRNMKRTAAYLCLPEEHLHINITYDMLEVNLSDSEHSFCKFQRCDKHGINMTAISAVSKLSWRAIKEDYSLDRYEEELEAIRNTPAITRLGRWPLEPVLPAADFVCSSVATGLPSFMPPLRPSSVSGCGLGLIPRGRMVMSI